MSSYTFKTKFQKDTTHLGSESSETQVNINKTTPNLNIKIPAGTYTAGSTFNITVQPTHPDGSSVIVPSIPIKIYINDTVVKSDTTSQEGYNTTLTVPSGSTTSISVKVVLEEDSFGYYNSATKTVTLKLDTPTSTAVDTVLTLSPASSSVEVGSSVKLTATLKTKSGTVLANKAVTFKKGDTTLDVVYTNSSGVATKTVSITSKGSNSFNAVFNGETDAYNSSSSNTSVTGVVTSIQPVLSMVSSSNIYQGWSLKLLYVDNNGSPLANKTVNITINGVTYQRTTNSDGIASLKINLAADTAYSFSANVAANGNYLYTSTSGNVKVVSPITVEKKPGCVSWDSASAPYRAWDETHKYSDSDVYNQPLDDYYMAAVSIGSKVGTWHAVQPLNQACFGFNIPTGSIIQKLEAIWVHKYNRSNSNIAFGAGTVTLSATGQDDITLTGTNNPGANTWTQNNASTTDVSGVSANALNQNAFQARITYNPNSNYNTGELHLGWFSIKVTYVPPQP